MRKVLQNTITPLPNINQHTSTCARHQVEPGCAYVCGLCRMQTPFLANSAQNIYTRLKTKNIGIIWYHLIVPFLYSVQANIKTWCYHLVSSDCPVSVLGICEHLNIQTTYLRIYPENYLGEKSGILPLFLEVDPPHLLTTPQSCRVVFSRASRPLSTPLCHTPTNSTLLDADFGIFLYQLILRQATSTTLYRHEGGHYNST